MTCTTFLYQSELNIPLPDPECQQILEESRKHTGLDWQVIPIQTRERRWFKVREETLYGLFVYVGGVGPWQQINFYREGTRTSINVYVPLETVMAYLIGTLVVPKHAKEQP
jgi:uncharacterized membrane protein YsdA (DUF1294 family)